MLIKLAALMITPNPLQSVQSGYSEVQMLVNHLLIKI